MSQHRLAWNAYLAYHLRGQARLPFLPLQVIEHRQSRRVHRMVSHAALLSRGHGSARSTTF